MKKTFISAVVATFAGTMAMAQSATDQIINDLTGQGFQRIEIDNGDGQIKVEAIRGRQKLEVVYDSTTGSILKQEVKRVRASDNTRPGVEIRDRNSDFVDASRKADDSRSDGTTGTAASTSSVSTRSTDTNEIVDDLQAQGFTRIEVKHGPSQTKVEAVRGTEKVETVLDRATGDVIKQESNTVSAGDDTRPGVEVQSRDRDFVDASGADDTSNDTSSNDTNNAQDDHNDQADDHSNNGASDDDSNNGHDDSPDHGSNSGSENNGSTDDNGRDNDSSDDNGSNHGGTDDNGSDNDSSDDNGSNHGSTDDNGSDNGSSDSHGSSDDNGSDHGSTDDNGSDHGSSDSHDSNDDHGNDDDSSENDD